MRDHEIAALVNALRDVAVEFHDSQQLRERISQLIVPALATANERIRELKADVEKHRELSKSRTITKLYEAQLNVSEELRDLLAAEREVSDKLVAALEPAIPVFRMEFLELSNKYAGAPYENSPAYLRVKGRYDNAVAALAEVAAIRAKQQCQHEWAFDGENLEGTEGEFSCQKCGATQTAIRAKQGGEV